MKGHPARLIGTTTVLRANMVFVLDLCKKPVAIPTGQPTY
jgi:hypothetical protein